MFPTVEASHTLNEKHDDWRVRRKTDNDFARRSFLGTGGLSLAVLSSACLSPENVLGRNDREQGPIPDIVVFNDAGVAMETTIEVVRTSDDSRVLHSTADIEPSEIRAYENPVETADDHRVTVAVDDDRRESFVWNVPDEEPRTGAYQLRVVVSEERVRFVEVVA